jgi:DNA mismatch repair ATPase MutS
LFQAEVRRCKKILNIIENNKNKNHFCIFDELFSGTNPYEAISTGNGYLEHLSKQKNVTFILTTHFMKLCYLFNKNKNIVNKNMNSFIEKDSIIYTYKINNGISKIKGGINILKQFNYPTNIINISKKTLENLT